MNIKNYSSKEIGDFVYSKKHKDLIPLRIIYTLTIYIISFIGLITCLKRYPKITLICLMSIFYYYLILGWYGKTRLFVPILIYNSIFFGNGIFKITLNLKKIFKNEL